ncbi:chemotaxis protein CheX [Paenibacillus sp. NPDC056579]|uniref:chemotaxis protein CheX n=1 Tax=unclassified Paenibacillus TaxID=185978 RepID=UPI001EF7C181|nr:chemotaxis protein CheX [Paenibacillus sp. H1-7]ULL18088.1 chemotaxis protein CheX [Paenibacillus sp. H1-7]
MQANFVNPFLTSSLHVIETLIQIKPVVGQLSMRTIHYADDYVWLKIGILGQMNKDILFGFPETVAFRMVSGMMGGYPVTQFDELCQSAVGELGNMISGNASTLLYQQGIEVDITPPNLVNDSAYEWGGQVFSIPLTIETIGEFNIYISA